MWLVVVAGRRCGGCLAFVRGALGFIGGALGFTSGPGAGWHRLEPGIASSWSFEWNLSSWAAAQAASKIVRSRL